MPYKSPFPCSIPQCPGHAQFNGYCSFHYRQYRKAIDPQGQRYDRHWNKARISHLNEHPLCVLCEKAGRVEPGVVVDHIVPHKGDYERFWDADNLQTLCTHHHAVKTAKETLNVQ